MRLLKRSFSILGIYAEKQKVLVDRAGNFFLRFGRFGHPVNVLAYADINDAAVKIPHIFHSRRGVSAGKGLCFGKKWQENDVAQVIEVALVERCPCKA